MSNDENDFENDEFLSPEYDHGGETSQLWVISYSDFMTILMIFFLMLFAHRLWIKKVYWDQMRQEQLRAARETQQGLVQRLSQLATIDVKAERIDIHLPDALLFDVGQADLRPAAARLLTLLVPEFKSFNGDIIVEGHTDNQPLGSHSAFHSNWELSVARAFSVIHCLTDHGLDPFHISARGYGPYRPRVKNDSPEHQAENRRIEIVLLNNKPESRLSP